MKDYTREELEANRPGVSVEHAIGLCLDGLFSDTTHTINDIVCAKALCKDSPALNPSYPAAARWGLTYEELIGTLLLAQDAVKELREAQAKLEALGEDW